MCDEQNNCGITSEEFEDQHINIQTPSNTPFEKTPSESKASWIGSESEDALLGPTSPGDFGTSAVCVQAANKKRACAHLVHYTNLKWCFQAQKCTRHILKKLRIHFPGYSSWKVSLCTPVPSNTHTNGVYFQRFLSSSSDGHTIKFHAGNLRPKLISFQINGTYRTRTKCFLSLQHQVFSCPFLFSKHLLAWYSSSWLATLSGALLCFFRWFQGWYAGTRLQYFVPLQQNNGM